MRTIQRLSVAVLVGGLVATNALASYTAPFTSSTPGAADPSFTSGGQPSDGTQSWSANTDTTSNYGWGHGTAGFAVLQVSNLGGVSFVEETDAKVTDLGGQGNFQYGASYAIGLAALGNDPLAFDLFNGDTWYAGNFNIATGKLQIDAEHGYDYAYTQVSTPFAGTFALGTTYHLTLAGTYGGSGDLTLAFTVSDGVNTTTLTDGPIAAASALAGQNFGLIDQSWLAANGTVQYNNYSLGAAAVPEPSSLALVGLALGLSMVVSRKRK